MFTSNILDACLEGHILSDNMPDHSEEFNNFRIIEEDSGRLVKGSLHIGSARALYSAVRADWDRDYVYTVIITGGDSVMDYFNESPGFHIIATDMPVTEVVNNLSELADRYSRMYSLRRHLHSSVSVADPIIEGAAEAMNADVFYLNGRMRVMSLSRAVNCPLFANIEVSSHLELSHAVTPKDEWTIDGEWAMRLSPLDYEGRTSAYLFVIVHNDTGQRFNSELMDQLYMSMEEFLHITFSDRSVADARFTTLAMDLLDGKINDEELLDERLRRISYSFTSHYFLIVIESETITKRVDAEVIPLLTSIYSGGFPIQYDNKVALLVQLEHYSIKPDINKEALRPILEEYRLYACVSNVTRNLLSLRTGYDKAARCLTLARVFCENKAERLFFEEDYAMYCVIDIAYGAVKNEYHGDYIKLCTPGAISLNYYDIVHGTNNSEILRRYLVNGGNTSQTAKELGIHRNTLMYRLEKIQEISGHDLSDSVGNVRMLFSIMVIDYLRMYRHRHILYTPHSDMDRE